MRGIVFDLDGTLIDSYAAIAASLNHARKALGLSSLPVEFVRRRVGRGLEHLVAELVGAEHVESAVARFREHYAEAWARGTRALPHAEDALGRLAAAGYPMAVASNKPARFGRAILRELGLEGRFASIQGPDLVGSTKPDPRMIRRCLLEIGCVPLEAVYVGDMLLDVESAGRAGIPVVLVRGGSSPEPELVASGQRVIGSLAELVSILPPACPPPPAR